MLYVFIGCLTFGIIYSLLSLVLGSHGSGDVGGGDHGGLHGHADSGDVPSPFNPLVIASAITTFGAVGLIGKLGFGMGDLLSSVFALGFAGAIGAAIFFGIVKLMYGSQSNSSFSRSDLVGIEAEVTTPIPENGLGEITYVINGVRCNSSAKSAYNELLERGEKVRIKGMSDNAATVVRIVTIDEF